MNVTYRTRNGQRWVESDQFGWRQHKTVHPEQLWDTTLNPETRTLIQVTIEDAAKAEKMVSLLMGDVVAPRKDYMYKYANFDEVN